jgi:hypothetical protein
VTRRGQIRVLVVLGALTVAVGGCASSQTVAPQSTASTVPMDVANLAGTWQGTASGPQGLPQPITVRIARDGTYAADAGVYTSQGTAQIRDGKLVLASTSTTGGQTAQRVWTAVLSEQQLQTQVIQWLKGQGSSSAGPFTFEVSRPKQ